MDYYLKCVSCSKHYDKNEQEYICPDCGPIHGTLDVIYTGSIDTLVDENEPSMFRYKLLPFSRKDFPSSLQVGWTPLVPAPRIAKRLGVKEVFIKDDTRNPSGSTKDRATAMAISRAHQIGADTIAAASTGNAASSLAVLAASAGKKAVIFCPADAPAPKLAQMLLFGAKVIKVKGTYDQAFDMCAKAVEEFGWYSRNTATNPYLAEGKKTAVLEVFEQLGFRVPDGIFVGVGDGCVYGSYYKAFKDLIDFGFADTMPALYGVQAEGSAPLAKAFKEGKSTVEPIIPQTFADSISVGMPRDQIKALRAARQSKGAILSVPDDLIREAMRVLAREGGVFAEPAGSASMAGLLKLAQENKLNPDGTYVVVATGSGLKDTNGAMSAVDKQGIEVSPDIKVSELSRFI